MLLTLPCFIATIYSIKHTTHHIHIQFWCLYRSLLLYSESGYTSKCNLLLYLYQWPGPNTSVISCLYSLAGSSWLPVYAALVALAISLFHFAQKPLPFPSAPFRKAVHSFESHSRQPWYDRGIAYDTHLLHKCLSWRAFPAIRKRWHLLPQGKAAFSPLSWETDWPDQGIYLNPFPERWYL